MLGLPVVFLIGLLLGSFGRAGRGRRAGHPDRRDHPRRRASSTAAVALALGDPEAVVVYARRRRPRRLRRRRRATGAGPSPTRGRRIHPVAHNGRTVGGILHREDLVADGAAMEVLGGIVAMGIDAQRLAAQQLALLADLHAREADLVASRLRLVQAEDTERRRISSDLHDGAQQHIVLLGLTPGSSAAGPRTPRTRRRPPRSPTA